jgi:hypothetical protein
MWQFVESEWLRDSPILPSLILHHGFRDEELTEGPSQGGDMSKRKIPGD